MHVVEPRGAVVPAEEHKARRVHDAHVAEPARGRVAGRLDGAPRLGGEVELVEVVEPLRAVVAAKQVPERGRESESVAGAGRASYAQQQEEWHSRQHAVAVAGRSSSISIRCLPTHSLPLNSTTPLFSRTPGLGPLYSTRLQALVSKLNSKKSSNRPDPPYPPNMYSRFPTTTDAAPLRGPGIWPWHATCRQHRDCDATREAARGGMMHLIDARPPPPRPTPASSCPSAAAAAGPAAASMCCGTVGRERGRGRSVGVLGGARWVLRGLLRRELRTGVAGRSGYAEPAALGAVPTGKVDAAVARRGSRCGMQSQSAWLLVLGGSVPAIVPARPRKPKVI